jgi:SAM-dependent methyltransferase
MASSFPSQIPGIVHLLSQLRPKSILDIGKGFGKYGFLAHEYVGIPNNRKLDSHLTLREQSEVVIEAIEADGDLMLPHMEQIYEKVHFGDACEIYDKLERTYDIVLMIDIIEHLEKAKALELLRYFLAQNSTLIIATPVDYFEQHLYESVFENHVSHWTRSDFQRLGRIDMQIYDAGAVYMVSNRRHDIRGFGGKLIKRLRRLARAFKNELY